MAFSPFERSASKAKLSSVSMRYGFQSNFMTITPPEHDNLSLLKLSLIRESGVYNNRKSEAVAEKKPVQDQIAPNIELMKYGHAHSRRKTCSKKMNSSGKIFQCI